MDNQYKKRYGYFWATDQENKNLEDILKLNILYKQRVIRSKAAFIRIAAFVLGELLKDFDNVPELKCASEGQLIREIAKYLKK
jgi:hypothetical protein